MIDTREELTDALKEASELEHGVLVSKAARTREGMIAGVAREEIAHSGASADARSRA